MAQIISYEEADRRGILYDLKYLSFLFDINSGWCIDAALLGNKTRFINHADNEKDGMNCEARIMLVNGEHKIKFVALRDIASGEELLFNYGKKFADKHGLSKKLPGAKDGAKKGVVVGEEALNALDGFRTRGRYTAIRGGHGSGRGGRKATKAAPMRSAAALSELVEQTIDEDESTFDTDQVEEENDDEEDGEDGRVKRPIKRPKRYTKY
jgi:histone-lysine N-methyltransferase EZH2